MNHVRKPAPEPRARVAVARPANARAMVMALQSQAGNQAVVQLMTKTGGPATLQRQAGEKRPPPPRLGRGWERMGDRYMVSDQAEALRSPIPPYPKGADVRKALAAERPRLLEILTDVELDQWQQSVDRRAAEREEAKLVQALLGQSPSMAGQGSMLEQQETYQAWRRRADAALPPPGPDGGTLKIETGRFLDPDIMKVDFDVDAERAFRLWAIQRLSTGPIAIRLVDPDTEDLRFVQQMLPAEGAITAASLQSIFPADYRQQVTDRPEIVQLRNLVSELEGIRSEIDPDFVNRLEKNEKYSGGLAFVRKWSEWLGEGDTDIPDVADWNAPYFGALLPGAELLRERKMELAVPLLRRAWDEIHAVADQFVKYEHRVTSGAGSAIKWLGRLKTAGAIAATLAAGPAGGVWRMAAVAGGYAGTQNLAQQASELGLGQRESLDLGAAVEDAAMASAMTLISVPLQAKFQGQIVEWMIGKEALERGVTASVIESRVASTLAGMGTAVYTKPAQIVMQRVVSKRAWPSSVEELCGMILDEVAVSGALTTVTDAVHADLAKVRAASSAKGGDAGPERISLDQRRSEEVGGHLLALGHQVAATGGASGAGSPRPAGAGAGTATPKAASYDPTLGITNDPALTRDPSGETGLASPDTITRVAHGVYKLSTRPVKAARNDVAVIDIAAEHIMQIIAPELPAGLPAPRIVVAKLKDPSHLGSYSKETHTITINADARVVESGRPEAAFGPRGDGYKRLLGLIYHEARHAEQTYHALRVRAGDGLALDRRLVAGALHRDYGVDPRLASAATGHAIAPKDTSPEARLGREIFAESFAEGPRKMARDFAQTIMGEHHEWQQRIDQFQVDLKTMKDAGTGESPEWWAVWKKAARIEEFLTKAKDNYFKLAEEIDARRAEFTVESVFDQIVEAQTFLNLARIKLATAQRDLDKIPAAQQTPGVPALKRVIAAAQELRDEFEKVAAMLPRPRQTPVSGSPAAPAAPVPVK